MATITLICANCGKEFQKVKGEYNRQFKKGITTFYCSCTCANRKANSKRKKPIISKICPVCGKVFEASTKAKGATFCSRSCASKGSVNEARREAGRRSAADHPVKVDRHRLSQIIKRREAWKYTKIKELLDFLKESYEFEVVIENFIYDLVLSKRKIIFEFDGPDHKYIKNEEDKNKTAENNGYKLHRIKVKPNTIIDASLLYKYLKQE